MIQCVYVCVLRGVHTHAHTTDKLYWWYHYVMIQVAVLTAAQETATRAGPHGRG